MKAARLLKLFEYFNSEYSSPRSNYKRSFQQTLAPTSAKKTVRFINKKMVIPILVLIPSFCFSALKANTNLNDDACTVDVIVSASTILHPGCQEGIITLTPQTADIYAYEIRPMYDLSVIQESSGMSQTGSSVTATYHMAGDYAVYITTLSGCTGIGYVTINQPLCPTITPTISVTNATLNGASDGAVGFSFNAGNSCNGLWGYVMTSSLGGAIYGSILDPSPSTGVISANVNNLWYGDYTLGIFPGGNTNYEGACVANTNFTISQPACDLSITPNVIQPIANSCNSGQVNLQITGQTLNDYYIVELYKNSNALATYYPTEIDGAGVLNISNLEAANYSILIYNGTSLVSCYGDATFDIIDPACNLEITAFTSTNSIAQACNSGSAEATLAGTTCNGYYAAELTFEGNPYANYYPAENNGTGTINMSGLMAGNYVLNVTNGAACTQTQNFTISEPACNIAISSLSSTNLNGFGCNDGTLDVAFTGTTCNSYYIVNLTKDGILFGSYYPAETASTGALNITLLPSGNYTIEVTNGNAICSATQNFIITEPACNTVIANFATNNPTINIGNNGGVIFNAQGSSCGGNYYYEIYNGASVQTSGYIAVTGSSSPALISGLVAGNYELKLYSAYGSTCVANQTFTLTDAPCNVVISGLTANNISSGCSNGTINFNVSGNTAYGYYNLFIEKDGSYYNSINITPTGSTTAFLVTDLTAGAYSLTLSDGYSNPCAASATINITQQACNIQIINPVIDEETTSQQTVLASVTGSISGNSCDGNYLVNLIQTDGSIFASQTIPVTNPNFLFENVTAGIYSIKAYPGVANESCVDQHDFILVDPCPTTSLAFDIDSTGGPCTFSTVHVTVTGSTDASKLYTVEYRLDGGAWTTAHGPYFGHTGTHTFDMYLSMDGYYEFRSGPLVVLPTCPVLSGLSIYKKYCDAYQTSTHVNNASNGCNNGSVNVYFTDPIKCLATVYHAKVYQAGIEVATMICSPVSGNNYVATAQLPAGSYSYTIFTEGDFTGLDLGCPLNGTFIIGTENCTLSISNETIYNNCTGSDYSAQVNGVTCNGSYLVELYKDGLLQSSNPITEYSGTGYVSFSSLQTGNYELKVYSNHLSVSTCVATKNFDINIADCNLSISNVVVTNAASDLSTNGSINFDIAGLECSGYQVTILKDGFAYFSNSVPSIGAVTPVSFSSLPPDEYVILLENGACNVSLPFTVLQGNPTCNLQVNVTNEIMPNIGCSNGSITVNMQGNANGNNYVLTITKDGNSIFNGAYVSTTSVTDIVLNLAAGNYVITLSYSGSGACISSINYMLNSLSCNLAIADVVTTQACDNSNNGEIAFDVTGTICQTSALQLLSNIGTVLVNSTISQSEGRLFENLSAGNYSIQVSTPSGCSVNYPFTIDPICDINLFNETITLEGAGSCTTAKLSYFVNATLCSANIVKLINNTDMTIFYQSNLPNQDGIDANEITDIPVGNYTLQVLNTTGNCSASYNFIVAPAPCSNVQFSNVTLGESTMGCSWAFGYDLNLGNCPGSVLTLSKNGNLVNTYLLNSTTSTEINNLSNGNYNLHLYTASGCEIDYPFEVNPVCDLAITNPVLTQACNAGSNGSIAFNLTGNICNNTPMQLLNNAGTVLSTQQINDGGNKLIANLTVGSYSVQVTNAGGCTVNYPFTIDPICDINLFNETVTLEGAGSCTTAKLSYFVNASYCSASLVKLINNSDMTIFYQSNLPNQDGIDANEITDIPVGNYTLQVLNTTGNCSASYNFIVAPAPCSNVQFTNVTINPSQTDGCYYSFGYDLNIGICPGSVLTLNQNGSAIETFNLIGSVSTEISNLNTGNYNLHLSSAGCEIDYPFVVTPSACNISITNASITSTGVLYCVNGRIDFDVTGTTCGTGAVALIQNGNILNTINWTTGNGTGLHFENMSPGNYSIVAVNNLFNVTCGDTLNFSINSVLPPLSISNVSTSAIGVSSCTSGSVSFVVNGQFCANSFVIVYDESNNFVFTAAYNNGGNQTYNVSGLAPGTYTIEFGLIGYSVTETFTINPNPCNIAVTNVQVNYVSGSENCTMANVSFTPTGDMCSNGSVILIRDGLVIDLHLWAMNTAPNLTFNNLAPGNYIIAAGSGSYGYCGTSYNFEVLPANCSLNISSITSTPSNGSNGTINVTGAGNYCGVISIALDAEISTGNFNNITTNTGNLNTQFTGLAPGNYRVTISSADSPCQDVEYITVIGATCNTNPIISASSLTICPGQTIDLNSNYLIGNVWSNGGTSFNTSITSAGTYTLTVTELNGCTGTTSITITNAITCVPATQMNNGVCGNSSYVKTSSITCLPVSGATQYEWQFSNGSGVYATKITTTNYVLLHSVTPAINWGTNWNIKVRAKIGSNVGPYSADCNIGIITDPTIGGVPLTQLRTQDCGKLNYRINADNRIIANPLAGAIQYEFEFSSSTTGMIFATKLQANNVLFLNTISPALLFPAQYNVRVRARIGATWGVFGTPCLIGIIGLNRDETSSSEVSENISDDIKLETFFDMTVYPNPFNEQATLIIHANNDEQIEVQVFDMLGNLVWKQIVLSNTNIGFGNEFAQGTYVVKAVNQEGNHTRFRFIKSK